MDITWVRPLFISMLLIDFVLFLFLLLRKMFMARLEEKKSSLRLRYESEIMEGFHGKQTVQDEMDPSIFERMWGRGVLRTLLLAYASFLSGDSRVRLHRILQRTKLERELLGRLRSSRLHIQKTAAFEAGEMGLPELERGLLPLLNSKDKELFYLAAKSLVKLTGRKHGGFVLYKAAPTRMLRKNQILTLFEFIEEDVEDILEKAVKMEEDLSMVAAALELYGVRQYHSGMDWILEHAAHPNKEIRIAALKAASAMGDPGDADYRNVLLSLWEDKAWEVRAFLARYLGQVRSRKSRYTLAKFLRDEEWQVRVNAAEALVAQGEEGVRVLVNLLASKEEEVQALAWGVLHRSIVTEDLLQRTEDVQLVMKLMRRLHTLPEKEVAHG